MLKYSITPNGKKPESDWADLWLFLGIVGFSFAFTGCIYLVTKFLDKHEKKSVKIENGTKNYSDSTQLITIQERLQNAKNHQGKIIRFDDAKKY